MSTRTLEELENILKIKFDKIELLKRALTHRSYLNEQDAEQTKHNERLEFLGDAVLELIITQYLFETYPERKEGELTSFRAALVRTESLAETSESISLGEFLFLSHGEDVTGGRRKPYILANTFEALLGAIYLDKGFDVANDLVMRILIPKLDKIVKFRLDIDAKSKIQELAQEKTGITPMYELVGEDGPDHDKVFTMQIVLNGNPFGKGRGKSKQNAEQEAAQKALENWEDLYKKYFDKKN